MSEYLLERRQSIQANLDRVFDFFADAANLEVLTPPWLHFRILTPLPIEMKTGALIQYRIRWRFVPVRWTTEILDWTPGRQFVDQQIRGPYRLWHHTHIFEETTDGVLMTDRVRYALPMGLAGRCMHAVTVRRDLDAIFDHRARQVERVFG